MVNSRCIKSTSPSYEPVNLVSFFKQQFRKIRAVLPGNSGYKSSLHSFLLFLYFQIRFNGTLFKLGGDNAKKFFAQNSVLPANLIRPNQTLLQKAFNSTFANLKKFLRFPGGVDSLWRYFLFHSRCNILAINTVNEYNTQACQKVSIWFNLYLL